MTSPTQSLAELIDLLATRSTERNAQAFAKDVYAFETPTGGEHPCLQWLGTVYKKDGRPNIWLPDRPEGQSSPNALPHKWAFETIHGRRTPRLKRECGTRYCCSPYHYSDKISREERA